MQQLEFFAEEELITIIPNFTIASSRDSILKGINVRPVAADQSHCSSTGDTSSSSSNIIISDSSRDAC
jgi:hypothetical protein